MTGTDKLSGTPAAGASSKSPLGIIRDWKKNPAVAELPLPSKYLYAIGDLHGDYDHALKLLESAGLIEKGARSPADVKWTGGDATLVCTGDLIDKGLQSIEVLQLMMAVQVSAASAGGKVVVTLGNHEMEFLSLATSDTFAKKDDDQAFLATLQKRGLYKDVMRGQDRLGPGGASVGAWLQNLPVGAKVGDFFFCHAGRTGRETVAEIDSAVREGVTRDGWGTKFLSSDDSLLEARKEFWGKAGRDEIREDAAKLGVDYLFYGHDPSKLEFPDGDKRQACRLFSHFSSDLENGVLGDMLFGMDSCNSSAVQKDEGVKGSGRMLRVALKDFPGEKRGTIDVFDEDGGRKAYDRKLGTG